MQEIVVGSEAVVVGKRIGKGGEGQVFTLNGRSGAAVKIYDSRLRVDREEKVRAMVHRGFAAQTELVAYPRDVVSDRRGNFLGFLMQLVSGYRPLHELYSPKSRLRHYPKADYRFIIRAALNVARAVGKVHQTGCVIGDFNHSGVLVSQDARVALIDADSFQFRLGQKTYPCVVGVVDFLPPELHGVQLATVVRTVEHDNFSLAVAIFQLLFMGRHPYAGRHEGPDLSIGQAIAQNRFAFSLARQSSTRTNPPPGALTLGDFPATVQEAFESAFGLNPNARPSPHSWIRTLIMLERSLNRCSKVKAHFYPNGARTCSWCDLSKKGGGFDMFSDVSTGAPNNFGDTLAIEEAIREILAFQFPVVSDLVPKSMVSARKGSSALREARSSKVIRALTGLLMLAGAGAGFFYAGSVWFIWLGLAGWGAVLVGDRKVDAKPFREAFVEANEALQRELSAFLGRSGLAEVSSVRGDLKAAITAYQSIDSDLSGELARFKSTRKERQRAAFLDQFSIRSAMISGIGPVRKATLISFGIETAGDVNRVSVLQVPGFGDVMTKNLLDWRFRHESRFRYNPARNAQDIGDENRLRGSFSSRKSDLAVTITNGLNVLRSKKAGIEALPARANNDRALLLRLKARQKAERDLELLGALVPNTGMESIEVFEAQLRPQQSKPGSAQPSMRSRSNAAQNVPNCPRCGSAMRRRSGRHGLFWGCSRYPGCKGARNI